MDKKNLNNRGYNRYLKLDGEVTVTIDYEKFNEDGKWDGLKGYLTNTTPSRGDIIANYRQLWTIEKAFRISKTDLRIRPIFHRLRHRIEAHICISFCAYKVYKELERQLQLMEINIYVEKTIEVLNSIFAIEITLPFSKQRKKKLVLRTPEQKMLAQKFKI